MYCPPPILSFAFVLLNVSLLNKVPYLLPKCPSVLSAGVHNSPLHKCIFYVQMSD